MTKKDVEECTKKERNNVGKHNENKIVRRLRDLPDLMEDAAK